MKSGKQRRKEIKAKRRMKSINTIPRGRIKADRNLLAHNNTWGFLPLSYKDRPFVCRDCGSHEIWMAEQQKWWYEVAKGHIDSRAIRCRPCRKIIRDKKAKQKIHMEEMAQREPHKNEAFFKKRYR